MNTLFDTFPELLEELSRFDDIPDPLKRLSLCLLEVHSAIEKVRPVFDAGGKYKLQVCPDEETLATLYAGLIFFHKCYQLENVKRFSSPEETEKFIREDQGSIRSFFETYSKFCRYYYSGATFDDLILFAYKSQDPLPVDPSLFEIPKNVNPASLLVACLLAFEKYGRLLKVELDKKEAVNHLPEVTFKYNDISVVEEMLGKHASESILINGKPATRTQIMDMLQRQYGREIPNWEQLCQSILNRKRDKFLYHTRIRIALEQKVKEIENKTPHK